MKKSSTDDVLTIGHFFDFFLASKQSDHMKELTSAQAMKAYRKGFLHLIPSSSTEQSEMPNMPLVLAETDNSHFLEYAIARNKPPNTLSKEQFRVKYFPMEVAFSWSHLPEGERPPLPMFVAGAKYEDTAFRICEFKDEGEAQQYIETTAKGLKNLAVSILKDNPQLLASLAQISEFQLVHGIRVLLCRLPQRAPSVDKLRFAHCIWWSHENLVLYAAPPVQIIPSNERERFLSGNIATDDAYKKELFLLDVYLKHSKRLLKRTAPLELTVQGFDQWNWNLPNTTPLQALGRRVTSVFPMSVAGKETTEFHIVEFTPERKGFLGSFRSGAPPKSLYAKYWKEAGEGKGWLRHLTPANSRLSEVKEKLQILVEAFNGGPPTAYVNIHYGPSIAATMLFFRTDFEKPLQTDELYRLDEWKVIFKNTLFNVYGFARKLPFISLEKRSYHIPSKRLEADNMLIWGIFKMNVYTDELRTEDIWIWPEEFGMCFLDAVSPINQIIGTEFLRLLDIEKENILSAISEENKDARKALLAKLDYFLARLQQK